MKRLINLLLIVTLSFFALTSCVTTVEAQDGVYTTTVIDTDNIEMAIVYGTPYIVNGVVLYYLYQFQEIIGLEMEDIIIHTDLLDITNLEITGLV